MPESQLGFTVRFENLAPGEVGVLLTALGLGEPELVLKLGGGKPACYGSATVRLDNLEVWGDVRKLYADYQIERASADLNEYLRSAVDFLLADQLQDLVRIWAYDMSRECPEGNY